VDLVENDKFLSKLVVFWWTIRDFESGFCGKAIGWEMHLRRKTLENALHFRGSSSFSVRPKNK